MYDLSEITVDVSGKDYNKFIAGWIHVQEARQNFG
jgi:hypothetical protein